MIPKHRRWQLPKHTGDRIALSVFTFGGIFLLWYELIWIWPTYYETIESIDSLTVCFKYIHVVIALFLAFQIYANMFMLTTVDTSIGPQKYGEMSTSLLEGWTFCEKCRRNVPPRSHHCKLCDVCVLKRDHHCWFAGYCVGYLNHRYYIAMVFYMVLAAVYCNLFNWTFVWSVKGEITLWNILSFFGPHFGWVLQYYDFYTMCITFLSTIGFILFILFTWLLQIQLAQLQRGQTKYDRKKGIKKYHLGSWAHNLREVIGDRGYLVFLFPWISSNLPGNGLSFNTAKSQ